MSNKLLQILKDNSNDLVEIKKEIKKINTKINILETDNNFNSCEIKKIIQQTTYIEKYLENTQNQEIEDLFNDEELENIDIYLKKEISLVNNEVDNLVNNEVYNLVNNEEDNLLNKEVDNLVDNLVDNEVDNLVDNEVDNLVNNEVDNLVNNEVDNLVNNEEDKEEHNLVDNEINNLN